MRPLRIIVSGFLGLLPAGGVAWDYVQYPLGFKALGHDVFYIEDTGLWPIYQTDQAEPGKANARYLERLMRSFDMADRWAYRDEATGTWYGLSEAKARHVQATADVYVNVSCANVLRDEYLGVPVRILLDSDPMFTQIQIDSNIGLTEGAGGLARDIPAYTHLFTFGENVGGPDCLVPTCGLNWIPTRQPILLEFWANEDSPAVPSATTVMNWTAAGDIAYADRTWGQKRHEWPLIRELPSSYPDVRFCVAVGQTSGEAFPEIQAKESGWSVVDANSTVADWSDYRQFVLASSMEVSIAKQAYVAARTGWFSCRSACYLAAGRPVVVQDTGWTGIIQSEAGALGFETVEEATEAVGEVMGDWYRHSEAAKGVASDYFDSSKVLNALLEHVA
jgi:hypothetical protein